MMWDNLTLGQYLTLYDIEQNKNLDLIDKQVKMISAIEQKDESYYDTIKYVDLLEKVRVFSEEFQNPPEFKAVDIIVANGNKYKFVHELDKISAGQFIDVNHFKQDVMNLHKTAACFFLGMKGNRVCAYNEIPHDKVAEDLLDAKFVEVQGCMLFFYLLMQKYIEDTLTFSGVTLNIMPAISRSFGIGAGNTRLN